MVKIKIFNTQVYGLEQSVIRSGFPMSTEVEERLQVNFFPEFFEEDAKEVSRAVRLGNAKAGSGHDCFLKGIVVQADFEAPQYFWQQFERYHFADIISSQSKMHRILKMDLYKQCNKYVDKRVIEICEGLIKEYNDELEPSLKKILFHRIISNLPMGLNLTAGITTNYLQLKTMYNQRKHHKMDDWSVDFCEWCRSLPQFVDLCLNNKD